MLVEGNETEDWLGVRDDFRNWLLTAGVSTDDRRAGLSVEQHLDYFRAAGVITV